MKASEHAILHELGATISRRRLDLQLTQAQLAAQAGVAKRTLERIEAGESAQLTNFLRIFRALGLLDVFERLLPERGPTPMELLKLKGKTRKRATGSRAKNPKPAAWRWGDES